jgi:hypothetical protein
MMTTELVTDPVIKQYLQEKVAGHMGSDPDAFKDSPVVGDGEGRHMLWVRATYPVFSPSPRMVTAPIHRDQAAGQGPDS